MADYATNLPQVTSSQAAHEVTVNQLVDALSPASVFGRNGDTSSALTWGVLGGRFNGTSVANGTLSLTASNSNYVVIHRTTLVASVSTATTNWNNTTTYGRAYKVTTGAATATNWEDHRASNDGTGILSATAAALGGLATVTGTGFVHITSGTEDGAATAVDLSSAHATGILAAARHPALTGDITTPSGSVATTLATVNSNVGSFGDATHVTALTVNAKGLITAASSVAITGAAPTGSAGGDLTGTYPNPTVDANKITLAKMATVATATVLGRNTAGTGNVEALTTIPTGTVPAFTGDVTNSAGSLATTIANSAVTVAKMANMAAHTILGNNTGSSAAPIALTLAQTRTELMPFVVVPVTYAGTTTVDLSTYVSYATVVLDLTLTGDVTFNLTNGADGQVIKLRVRQDGSGGHIWTSGANLRFSADLTAITLSTGASKLDYVGFEWNGTNSKADVLATNLGY